MKVGDKVICVKGYTDLEFKLETGQIYQIVAVSSCKCEGWISVGLSGSISTRCPRCGVESPVGSVYHYQSRFRPVDYNFGEEVCSKIEELELV